MTVIFIPGHNCLLLLFSGQKNLTNSIAAKNKSKRFRSHLKRINAYMTFRLKIILTQKTTGKKPEIIPDYRTCYCLPEHRYQLPENEHDMINICLKMFS